MADLSKLNVNNTEYDLKDAAARATKYGSDDATETAFADDDKVPFYDTSASARKNSTWANIKAKLKAYFDTIYGSVTGVKGDSESTYRTGNVNITPDNIGALSKNGGTISGNILPDNNFSHALGNYGHAFGAVSAAAFYVGDSVNGGNSKVYFEGTGLLNSVKIPEGNGTIATQEYVESVLNSNLGYRIKMYSENKQSQTFSPWVGGIYYKDFEFELPEAHSSGNFLFAISHNSQFWVVSTHSVSGSATKVSVRCCTVTTSAIDVYVSILYLV